MRGLGLAAVFLALSLTTTLGCATAPERIPVTSVGDLPRRSYPISGKVSELLRSEAQFATFAEALQRDLEEELRRYDIRDAAALQERYGTLAQLYVLDGDFDRAMAVVDEGRALEDKPALRLMYGQRMRAMAAAHRDTGGAPGNPAFADRYRHHLEAAVGALPWATVQDVVEQTKGMMEIYSANLLLGIAQSQLDPVAERSGGISGDLAPAVVDLYFNLHLGLPLKDDTHAVYAALIAAHETTKPDIWHERGLVLDPAPGCTPVVVGVWDSGVDTAVFPGRLFVNEAETANGRDDDGNGFVDDVHGIAFDLEGRPVPELLCPAGGEAERLPSSMRHLKGLTDLQASVDSPEATALRQALSTMEPDEVGAFLESLGFAAVHAHGTHVAGILAEGNPCARILTARVTFDHRMIPAPLAEESARRHAESYRRTARYLREHEVRVVNMSWSWTLKEIEHGLEANGIGENAEARGREARRLLGILAAGLREAIEGSPGILFVTSAGNADDDAAFAESLPASLAPLPNLVIVGAVDQAGERTDFTSGGEHVTLYANGFEVDSFVPGGGRMKLSGTSMSAPNVANLAAKLIATNPGLGPQEVVALMVEASDALPTDPTLRLIHPRRAAELAARPLSASR